MAIHEDDIIKTRDKYNSIKDCLSEKGRRLWAAIEATAYGYGGSTLVCKAIGISTASRVRGVVNSVCPQNRAYGSVHGSSWKINPTIHVKPMLLLGIRSGFKAS